MDGISPGALNEIACDLIDRGLVGGAIDTFHQALQAEPANVDVRLNLAVLLRRMGWLDRARHEAEAAARMQPHSARAHLVLGALSGEQGRWDEARGRLATALTLEPQNIDAMLNLASIYLDLGQDQVGESLARRALALEPERAEALSHIATLAARRMDFETALPLYDRAVSWPQARWNRALALLSMGRWREGWEDFEARLEMEGPTSVVARRFPQPMLRALPQRKTAIHVHYEQGMGDTLQFARYVPRLAALGHEVSFEVPPEMVSLMAESLPDGIAICARALDYPGAVGLPAFDAHIPVMSLPWLFGDDAPWWPGAPYFKAPDGLRCPMQIIAAMRPLVGVCWAGMRRGDLWCQMLDSRRSLALREIVEAIPPKFDGSLVSLQLGPVSSQLADVPGVYDLSADLKTWADTAALITQLDLVVSVDTAVAHLAAAMGKPVLMLDRWDHCWRWPEKDGTTAWYPSMTILRQRAQGDWSWPLEQLGERLAMLGP